MHFLDIIIYILLFIIGGWPLALIGIAIGIVYCLMTN